MTVLLKTVVPVPLTFRLSRATTFPTEPLKVEFAALTVRLVFPVLPFKLLLKVISLPFRMILLPRITPSP